MENLKQWRIENGYTQWDLALKLGVSLGTYRLWEAGLSKPNEENREKLEKLLSGED